MTGWIEPPDPTVSAEYWVTRRDADAAEGYGGFNQNIRVKCRWTPFDKAWVTGSYWTQQGYRPALSCLHSNNGWRIDPDQTERT